MVRDMDTCGTRRLVLASLISIVLASMAAFGRSAKAQVSFDREPINYSSTEANDPVEKLQRRMDKG